MNEKKEFRLFGFSLTTMFGIGSIKIGVLSALYFLIQTGYIKIGVFINEGTYTESFYTFLLVFMILLAIGSVVLMLMYRGLPNMTIKSISGFIVILTALNLIWLFFWGMVPVTSVLIAIAGIKVLLDNKNK